MLVVDGVEYRSWTSSSEAELESFVEAHSKHIFGEDSLYFPVKTRLRSLGGVGSIPVMWVLVTAIAYVISEKYGLSMGVLATCGVDLILELVATVTGIWTWLEPYTVQVYFGSTVANALVWAGMCLIGIRLWESKGRAEGPAEVAP